MTFWTADSDLGASIILGSSGNSCFKRLHPLLVLSLQQISMDVGPVPL